MLNEEIVALYPTHCCNKQYFDELVRVLVPMLKTHNRWWSLRQQNRYEELKILLTYNCPQTLPNSHVVFNTTSRVWTSLCYKSGETATHTFSTKQGLLCAYLPFDIANLVVGYTQEYIQNEELFNMPWHWNTQRYIDVANAAGSQYDLEAKRVINQNLTTISPVELVDEPEVLRRALAHRVYEQTDVSTLVDVLCTDTERYMKAIRVLVSYEWLTIEWWHRHFDGKYFQVAQSNKFLEIFMQFGYKPSGVFYKPKAFDTSKAHTYWMEFIAILQRYTTFKYIGKNRSKIRV